MKTVFGFLLVLYFSSNLFAQKDTLVFVKEVNWSGGQCCSHGTDSEVFISKKTYKSIKKIHLVLQQFEVDLTKSDFYYDATSQQYKTKRFGFSESTVAMQDMPIIAFHDINASMIKLTNSNVLFAAVYVKRKNRIVVSKVKIESEYLAYP